MSQFRKIVLEAYKSELKKLTKKLGDEAYFECKRRTQGKRATVLHREWMRKRIEELKDKIKELENGIE